MTTPAAAGADVWSGVVGQPRAVEQLKGWVTDPVHAYIFVGPPGSGKRAAARAFAAGVLAHGVDGDAGERQARLALTDRHPDVEVFTPQGRQVDVESVRAITPMVFKKPIEGRRRIVIIERVHAMNAAAAASLLKTVEEPPPSAIIILLAERVIPEHVAIASRAMNVAFGAVASGVIEQWLVDQGAGADDAARIAIASGGDTERARLLMHDDGFAARADAWAAAPARLDGSGFAAGQVTDEIRSLIDDAVSVLGPLHAAEVAELTEREAQLGIRGSGRKDMEARHKREVRKIRDDELRFGLGLLARCYGDELAHGGGREMLLAVGALRSATEALERNPAEALLLLNLFWTLPPLSRG